MTHGPNERARTVAGRVADRLAHALAGATAGAAWPAATRPGPSAGPTPAAVREATRLTRSGRLAEAMEILRGTGAVATRARPTTAGGVTRGSFTGPAGTREYRLLVPPTAIGRPGLLVMLHGGTQNAADFAAATGIEDLAVREGFVVVHPEQSRQANAMGYWNWFEPRHQRREGGEPSLVAGIVREVVAAHDVDPARVYVAGFSAGAAMAAVLGVTHPDLVAGVGVHSGLAPGAARDVGSAFAAMRGGAAVRGGAATALPCPTIVVHGDADGTVAPVNAETVVAAARPTGARRLADTVDPGGRSGRGWTRERWADAAGRVAVERWTVHGSGHAWSGGRAGGSYTDPQGPDASAAMVRFFGLGG